MSLTGKRVLVVGAGVQGLASALVFSSKGASVRVVGEDVEADTTSYGAAAFWRPYFVPNTSEEDVACVVSRPLARSRGRRRRS